MTKLSPEKQLEIQLDAAWLRHNMNVPDEPLPLIREALILNEYAYEVVAADERPMRQGFIILSIIVGLVAGAMIIGLILGLLTTPRVDLVADSVLDKVEEFSWYQENAAADPDFTGNFATNYTLTWQALRGIFGLPSTAGTISAILALVVSSLTGWLVYGALAHGVARWLGGQASYKQFLGPLGLSFAPMLLLTLELIPGLAIASTLVFFMLIITKFQAIKRTYNLSPGYSLAATVSPYFIAIIVVLALAALAIAMGLNQIPFLDSILRFLRFI